MFESIKYIGYSSLLNKQYKHNYQLIDSDFKAIVYVIPSYNAPKIQIILSVIAVIQEYHIRNLNIIENLFLLNIFMLKQQWHDNMNEILEYQKDFIDMHPGLHFNEKYYNDLVKYTNKMMVIF